MEIPWNELLKIIIAFLAGGILGFEREYHDKPAGLRTIILITVGSTMFSLLSLQLNSVSPDRIASNVVTGIGFLGAGVIFKEGINVKGLTSAATIWVAASIGMAIGFGNFYIAGVSLILTLVTLIILSWIEKRLNATRETQQYLISFDMDDFSTEMLEKKLDHLGIEFRLENISKIKDEISVIVRVKSFRKKNNDLIKFLTNEKKIKSFKEGKVQGF